MGGKVSENFGKSYQGTIRDNNLKPYHPRSLPRPPPGGGADYAGAAQANPAQLPARCLAPGARTPPGVLAPGASPRVRWNRRGHPQHRKWPWRVCLQILGELKQQWGLVTVGHRRPGAVSTEQSGWGWAGPYFLAALSHARPSPSAWRWAVSQGSSAATGECSRSGEPRPPWPAWRDSGPAMRAVCVSCHEPALPRAEVLGPRCCRWHL